MYIISLPFNIFSILNWRGTETDRERQNSSSFTSQQIKGSVYYIIRMIIVRVVANHSPRQCVLSGSIKGLHREVCKLAFVSLSGISMSCFI